MLKKWSKYYFSRFTFVSMFYKKLAQKLSKNFWRLMGNAWPQVFYRFKDLALKKTVKIQSLSVYEQF